LTRAIQEMFLAPNADTDPNVQKRDADLALRLLLFQAVQP